MVGIVIITASRDDVYQDYLRTVKEGLDLAELTEYLPDDFTARADDDESVRLWGTSVVHTWQKVEHGDIALFYHDGRFVGQARVLSTREDPALATHLFDIDGDPQDSETRWEYLTFFTDFEEIDVELADFNDLVGYNPDFYPQGFTRVADTRLDRLEREYDSVETAITELTDVGSKVHTVDDDDDESEDDHDPVAAKSFTQQLVTASTNGDEPAQFEQLVANAFARIGFDAQWVEGGDDTDVQLTSPASAVVEVKARGNGRLQSPDGTRIQGHQEARGADHAVVVAPGFTPAAIEDANRSGLVLLTAERLAALVERAETYGVVPESIADVLFEPGAFQDDRLDEVDDLIGERKGAAEQLVAVLEALERGGGWHTASEVHYVLVGMLDTEVPDTDAIEQSLVLLAHPSLGVVERGEQGYRLVTSAENGIDVLRQFGGLIEGVRTDE
ncbi:restriction endonuclease [Haloarcula nitratireducens]|uniref:Restriction endonuclease n=1 Tax=Haloarcula nitratireducens TaxID=2487749 RepID=A0AAW4PK91_9EURY|nr:restriction endonuclease [Halomicroarcula nitratireducens]MBX0298147.1 restriction endonuclease [Halomicroarcula nitratireducens]